jgi:hypothetical protein
MQTRLFPIVALALVLGAARAEAQFTPRQTVVPAEDFRLELGMAFWQPEPGLTLTTGDVRVGSVDFVQEFGIAEERFREFRAVLRPGLKHKIRFAYVPLKYQKDAVLQRSITFQNLTFPVSADATTDINWDVYRFGYEWDFITMPRGFVGVIGELKYNKVQASVSATGPMLGQSVTIAADVDQQAPVPTIGGIARGYIGENISITGEFTGFKLDRENFGGKFYDFDIYGAAHLGKFVGVQVGYRNLDVDFQADDEQGVMTMKGPYFGAFLRF